MRWALPTWFLAVVLAIISASVFGQTLSTTQCVASAYASGTSDAITIPALPCALTTNLLILSTNYTNTTTTPTLQPLGLPAQTIVRNDGSALQLGDLAAGGKALLNPTGTKWILLNPVNAVGGISIFPFLGLQTTSAFGTGIMPAAVPSNATVVLFVDNTSTNVSPTCGLTSGAGACENIETAFNNLCTYYQFPAGTAPTIKLTTGEIFTSGLLISTDPNSPTPQCIGMRSLVLDLCGATINTTNGSPVYLRFAYMRVRVLSSCGSNGTLKANTTGHLLEARGGGSYIEPDGHLNFGPTPAGYSQLLADESGLILNCPSTACSEDTGNVITGGGGYFIQELNSSSVEWEGQQYSNGSQITINGGVTYDQAFVGATDGGGVTFFSVDFVGTNPTGPQYQATKAAVVDDFAQTPCGACIVSTCYNASTNPYGNQYMPGTTCGQYDYAGGRFTSPGTPLMSGANIGPCAYNAVSCTNGYQVKGTDSAYFVQLGQITTNTNNTVYTVTVTQATNSQFEGCSVNPTNPTILNGFGATYTGPANPSTNGYETINWTGNGNAFSAGLGWWVTCRGHG